MLLGGAPNHQLAVDVHFTPLLLELGAAVPVRGLFVLEADVPDFGSVAASWAAEHGPALVPGRPAGSGRAASARPRVARRVG